MNPHFLQRLTDGSLWIRTATSILFMVINSFVQQLLVITGLAQHGIMIVQGKKNERLSHFSGCLTNYTKQMLSYFNLLSEKKPFPFSAWPNK